MCAVCLNIRDELQRQSISIRGICIVTAIRRGIFVIVSARVHRLAVGIVCIAGTLR